jgi:hypothetical protein
VRLYRAQGRRRLARDRQLYLHLVAAADGVERGDRPGHALPVPPPCDQRDPRLNVAWRETEGAWRGNWQPSGGTGVYNARWTQPTESASATLQIEIRPDNNVVVLRSQAEGNCHYSGRLGPTGWTVSGTYYCDWQPVPRVMQPWSAVMGTGRAPGS